jgi:hypothetical protein
MSASGSFRTSTHGPPMSPTDPKRTSGRSNETAGAALAGDQEPAVAARNSATKFSSSSDAASDTAQESARYRECRHRHGKLDLYLIYPGRFWQLVASLKHLKFGLAKPEVIKRLSAVTVALRTDRPRTVNADGELATKTPAKFEVPPKALTVMVPRTLSPNHTALSRQP